MRSKRLSIRVLTDWKNLDVIVDSPLAAEFTKHYRSLKELWDKEARRKVSQGRHPLAFEQLYNNR